MHTQAIWVANHIDKTCIDLPKFPAPARSHTLSRPHRTPVAVRGRELAAPADFVLPKTAGYQLRSGKIVHFSTKARSLTAFLSPGLRAGRTVTAVLDSDPFLLALAFPCTRTFVFTDRSTHLRLAFLPNNRDCRGINPFSVTND